MAFRQDTDPNSPTYGQLIDDGGTQTPNIDTTGPQRPPSMGEWTSSSGLNMIAAAYRAAGHEPTRDELYQYGVNLTPQQADDAVFQIQLGFGGGKNPAATTNPNPNTGPSTTPTTTPNTTTGGAVDPAAVGQAWMDYARGLGHTPRSSDLAAFVAAHPEYGASVSGGKKGNLTINGRQYDALYATDSPNSYPIWNEINGSSSGDGSLGGMLDPSFTAPFTQPFTAPPGSELGAYTPPAPFSYQDFVSPGAYQRPTADSILQDPSYQFRLGQGRDAIENSAAARGVLNTGGTLADIMGYGQNFASQEYSNIDTRNFAQWNQDWMHQLDAYGTNRNNARDSYLTNLGVGTDARDYAKSVSDDVYSRAVGQYHDLRDIWYANQSNPFDKVYKLASLGAGSAAV